MQKSVMILFLFILTFTVRAEKNNMFLEKQDCLEQEADTTLCFLPDQKPILLSDECEYTFEQLLQFVHKKLKYPPIDFCNIYGVTYISFIIEKDGTVQHKKWVKKSNEAYDAEAMRVINLMKKWKPAHHNGKPVRYEIILPIHFYLQ